MSFRFVAVRTIWQKFMLKQWLCTFICVYCINATREFGGAFVFIKQDRSVHINRITIIITGITVKHWQPVEETEHKSKTVERDVDVVVYLLCSFLSAHESMARFRLHNIGIFTTIRYNAIQNRIYNTLYNIYVYNSIHIYAWHMFVIQGMD